MSDAVERYPLSLALFDYVPVILTLLAYSGFVLLQPALFAGVEGIALLGALLMFAGGFLKATWKTIIAATEKDIRWMEHGLFLLLTPGACLFAWVMWIAAQRWADPDVTVNTMGVLYPLVICGLFMAISLPRLPRSAKWFLPLVVLLTLAMALIAVLAAWLAWQQQAVLAALLFIASFVASSVTARLSRRAATIDAQWVMEWANSVSAGLFLAAVLAFQAGA